MAKKSYPQQYREHLRKALNDQVLYHDWISKRAGLILADTLLTKGYKAFEIGYGDGGNFHLLKKCGSISGIDIEPEFKEIALSDEMQMLHPPVEFDLNVGDATTFRMETNYHLIISSYVLWDRVPVSNKYFNELIKHLNHKGYLFVYTLTHEKLFYTEKEFFKGDFATIIKTFGSYFIAIAKRFLRKIGIFKSLNQKVRDIRKFTTNNNLHLVNETIINYPKGQAKAFLWYKP